MNDEINEQSRITCNEIYAKKATCSTITVAGVNIIAQRPNKTNPDKTFIWLNKKNGYFYLGSKRLQEFKQHASYVLDRNRDLLQISSSDYLDINFPRFGEEREMNWSSSKMLFSLNLIYMIDDFSPELILQILDGEKILYANTIGVSAYPGVYNRVGDEVLLDAIDPKRIKIRLFNEYDSCYINIKRNSFYKYTEF